MLWGISYANLKLLMVDAISTFYNTDKGKGSKGTNRQKTSKGMGFSEFLGRMHDIKR